MERVLLNLIFDENKIVTAVTLSRYQDISIDEAHRTMKEFHEKHNNSNGLWATFNVTGSTTICGVCANSTVLYRDTDLDKIKDAFNEIFAVELFSLQTVEVEDLRRLMTLVRLQDQNFLRINIGRAPVYSNDVSLMARDIRIKVNIAKSDILLAMKNVLDDHEHSCLSDTIIVDGEKKEHVEGINIAVKDRFLKSNDIFYDNQSQNSSTDSDQSSANMDNLSQSSASSSDSLKSKSCQDGLSKSSKEEVSIQAESEDRESPSNDKEQASCKRRMFINVDEVPVKKRQAERFVETYKDEDGFLITKEVIRMVETNEPTNERESRPLHLVNISKGTHPTSTKKNSIHVSNTPKISSFFSKNYTCRGPPT